MVELNCVSIFVIINIIVRTSHDGLIDQIMSYLVTQYFTAFLYVLVIRKFVPLINFPIPIIAMHNVTFINMKSFAQLKTVSIPY